ncbi:MAG TPA: hypothetical protein VIT92_00610 [Burkholderiaceae bacterium]
MQEEQYHNTKALLDRWADWMHTGEPIAEGAPRQCMGAPDARIHSFEDMEIEDNKRVVRAVHGAVYQLPILERQVVMMHYGLTASVWRTQFDALFDAAIENLFKFLKEKISC